MLGPPLTEWLYGLLRAAALAVGAAAVIVLLVALAVLWIWMSRRRDGREPPDEGDLPPRF